MTFPSPLIGILGGMGPQAGLDLAEKMIAMTRTGRDQDHLPFVLFSLPECVPDRTGFLFGNEDVNPAHAIAEQFEKMSALGVDVAAMACNTAHAAPIFDVVLDELRLRGVKLRILNMIGETVEHIRRTCPQVSRVGVLATQGTYRSRLYDEALEAAGLEAVLPDAAVRQDDIHAALYSPSFGIKTHPEGVPAEASRRILSAIRHVRSKGAEAVILGCTELPLAVRERQVDGLPILDPAAIVAERLIRATYPERLAHSGGG